MRRIVLGMAALVFLTIHGASTVFGQQTPRRSVTYVFQPAPVAGTQWSPGSNGPNAPAAYPDAIGNGGTPSTLPGGAQGMTQSPGNFPGPANYNGFGGNQGPTPTVQQMQNPSGAQNLSHAGMWQNQYTTTNNYIGRQFDNWTNLRQQPRTLDEFQAFNRTQPPANSGAYYSPNTYFGAGYNQWSNLSSGTVTPNYLGGYIYQP